MPATRATEKKTEKKAEPENGRKKAKKGDVPDPLNDLNTQEDSQAVPGHFVRVTGGEYEGTYGVFIEPADENNVVVRTRDSENKRIVVAYTDLEPAEPGQR